MSKQIEIDGFTCELHDGPGGIVIREAFCKKTGLVSTHVPGRWTSMYAAVPPLVLLWLMKPLLRSAYAQGWADRNGQLDGAEMPRIYEDT